MPMLGVFGSNVQANKPFLGSTAERKQQNTIFVTRYLYIINTKNCVKISCLIQGVNECSTKLLELFLDKIKFLKRDEVRF